MSTARDRILSLCRSADDPREFRLGVLDVLRQAIGFRSYVFMLTDPHTCVGAAPLADVPIVDKLPQLIRLKYATALNRWTALGTPPVATLAPNRSASPLWQELLGQHGVVDIASMVFADRFGCWGFLDLWRTEPEKPFTETDTRLLADIAAPVTEALRQCQAKTFTTIGGTSRAAALVILLSPELEIIGLTPQTHDYLRVLVPTPPDKAPIPAGAYNVAAQLLASEAGVDTHPPTARVHLAGGLWLVLRAARLGENIAVTIEQASASERLSVFSAACGLTKRETELLSHLTTGANNRETAQALHLSEHTVQDHLKSVFAKTGTHSRRELLARVAG